MADNSEDVEEFLKEGRDYFEDAEPLLIDLSANPDSAGTDAIDQLFRIFHSIKGVAGFLNFNNVQKVTHKVESSLDLVRSGDIKLDESLLSIVLKAGDLIKKLFDFIEQNGNDETELDAIEAIIEELGTVVEEVMGSSNSFLDVENGDVLFPCFNDAQFLSHFSENFRTTIGQVEAEIFRLLDGPGQLDAVVESVSEISAILETNIKIILPDYKWKLLQEVIKLLKEYASKEIGVPPEVLGNLFSAIEFYKKFAEELVINDSRDAEVEELSEELSKGMPTEDKEDAKVVAEPESVAVSPDKKAEAAQADMRVQVNKIDKLIELIEELGVVTGVVSKDPESDLFNIYEFQQASNKLQQITEYLQDVAMSVRLVPLESTFKKMSRLVFDVSRKLNKKVNFDMAGTNTEIDRNMVEIIQDPLVHIFRNALDHGLESTEKRVDIGKSEFGVIKINAWHSGGEVQISISDDGGGVPPEIVFRKAVEKGIVAETDDLTDQEKIELIFAPGFSTSEEVTDFSGRGVGMDVVRNSIEALNGQIELNSVLGEGTTFLIRVPLTSTIVEGMLIKVGSLTYTIRMASICESFKVKSSMVVVSPDGAENVNVRGAIYPIVRVSNLSRILDYVEDIEKGIIILVENKGRKIALFVDEIIGTNQGVIKQLPDYFKGLEGIAGSTIIGTGSSDISWTLDIDSLIQPNGKLL